MGLAWGRMGSRRNEVVGIGIGMGMGLAVGVGGIGLI
jgi:hypothetical protein